MTHNELRRRFPNATESFLKRNAENSPDALPAQHKEPTQGRTLECLPKRKKAGSHSLNDRIGLGFTVYAMRPADADGWDFKEIIDALVGAKIVDGDGWNRIFIAWVKSEKVCAKNEERTEISIVYPTETIPLTGMDRPRLLDYYWSQCGGAWNKEAFDAFMETLSDDDLRNYIEVGKE